MSVPTEFHSTLCKKYRTLCISVRQPITEVKAECNAVADVREIGSTDEGIITETRRVSCILSNPIRFYKSYPCQLEVFLSIQMW